MKRERILVAGDTGSGKTTAIFEVAVDALRKGHQVFFMSFDGGHLRFLPRVQEWEGSQFFVFDASDWETARKAYRDVKRAWSPGDWVMQDRVDMAWEFIRAYWSSAKFGVSDDELDEYFLQKRLGDLQASSRLSIEEANRIRSALTVEDLTTLDWDVIKGSFRGVVFDPASGPDARLQGINVMATELALPGINRFTSKEKESEASKTDPRKIREHGYTIQGEKNVQSWYDTVLLLKYGRSGYTVSTLKDRERPGMFESIIAPEVGFLGTYQSAVGEEVVA